MARWWFLLEYQICISTRTLEAPFYISVIMSTNNSPGVIELLFLLVDLAVNLLADLSKLKLGSEDLVLLLLKGSLGLLQRALQLLLLDLKTSPLVITDHRL